MAEEVKARQFRIYGTGHEVDHHLAHFATVQDPSQPLVWHIFVDD